jgi:hypothetical protein
LYVRYNLAQIESGFFSLRRHYYHKHTLLSPVLTVLVSDDIFP